MVFTIKNQEYQQVQSLRNGGGNLSIPNTKFLDQFVIFVFIAICIFLNSIFPIILSHFGFDLSQNITGLFVFFGWNSLIAYRSTVVLLSFLSVKSLPKLKDLTTSPRVALLYLTKDDASYEILAHLDKQVYSNYEVYVLDDSEIEDSHNVLFQFPYKIVRRKDKSGYKAGNLNYWIENFAHEFEYFVVLDSDSAIPPNYIAEMLKFAEHQENREVAIFQSRLCADQSRNLLSKYQTLVLKIQQVFFERIGNRMSTMENWGHNILVRVPAIRDNGGFNPNFVGEDIATTFDLWEKGWSCHFVDVPSWEGVPSTLESFTKKTVRTTLSNAQLILNGKWSISVFHKMFLFMSIYPFILLGLSLPFLLKAVLSFPISIGAFSNNTLIVLWENYSTVFLFIWGYFGFFIIFDLPLFIRAGLNIKEIAFVKITGLALSLHLLWPIIKGLVEVLLQKRLKFTVTPKKSESRPFSVKFSEIIPTIFLVVIFIVGIVWNPIAFVFNVHWLTFFLIAPFLLMRLEKERLPRQIFYSI
ncbi:MAG: glycosyltransferase family 2 protein [Candidatus Edwardsbacteria bacterium]